MNENLRFRSSGRQQYAASTNDSPAHDPVFSLANGRHRKRNILFKYARWSRQVGARETVEYRTGHIWSRAERNAIEKVAERAAHDARKVLPELPTNLRLTVQVGDRVIPETGETGSFSLPSDVYWTVDPNHQGGVLGAVNAQLRAALFHEWYRLVREATFSPKLLVERAVNEGLATAFERDYGGAPTPWGAYPNEVGAWAEEFLALPNDAPFNQWMYRHPDGRRWIGYKVGTYLADRAVLASGLTLAQLAAVSAEKIIAWAQPQ